MTFAAGFIAGGIVCNVLPTLIAIALHERNMRRGGRGLWLERG